MAIPVWAVGQVLSAADVNAWFVPIAVNKLTTTSRNTTTTLADDPDLVLPLAANALYHLNGVIFYDGATMAVNTDPGGLKWSFTVPAGTTGQYFAAHMNLSNAFTGAYALNWTDTGTAVTLGSGLSPGLAATFTGFIDTAGTAGNMTYRWAQNTSSGTNTKMLLNSYLTIQRIG